MRIAIQKIGKHRAWTDRREVLLDIRITELGGRNAQAFEPGDFVASAELAPDPDDACLMKPGKRF